MEGKDPSFKKYKGVCGQCEKGIKLGNPRAFKNLKKALGVPKTFEDLMVAYDKFENERVLKAEKLTGRKVKADSFTQFLAERCEICPHSLLSPLSYYWLETSCLFDGEMGLTLPAEVKSVPALFFDCLALVRNARKRVSEEEKKKD